jgi:hypothetical protein
MAEYSPRQILHDQKGPILCKQPSDVPHHHFNVRVVHAPRETAADHEAHYQDLLQKANVSNGSDSRRRRRRRRRRR